MLTSQRQITLPRFENSTERGFCEYLISQGYAFSTAMDYIRRLRRITSLDKLINQNLDGLIASFENGIHKALNERSHNAHSCALKRFKEYGIRIGVIA